MDNPHQHQEEPLSGFDKWLQTSKVEPPADLLARVRNRLDAPPAELDDLLDELFLPDTGLRDPDMVRKVRLHLSESSDEPAGTKVTWFHWLAPLAAAATLTLAFVSFQNKAPENTGPGGTIPELTVIETPSPQMDSDVTEIFALAVNLKGDSDMSKLESVEDLAFLFD